MDAVNRYWQIVRALVLARGLVVAMLALFYLLAALLALMLESDKKAALVLVLCAIPACGFLATATERVIQYSVTDAALGLPRHAELLRRTQWVILGLVVGIPACIALGYGAEVSYAALLLVPAALGVLLALKARWLFAVWIVVAVASRFSYSLGGIVPGLSNPVVRLGLIGASLAGLYWWLGLASRIETRARGASLVLADARHEASATFISETMGLTAAQVDGLERAYDREITEVSAGVGDAGISGRALALGLGIDVRPRLRGIAQVMGLGWVVLLGLHLIDRRGLRDNLYLWVAIFAASALFARINALRTAWQSRGDEEALLLLTPRWPDARSVKRLIAELIVKCQVGAWITWILIILPFSVLGWLGRLETGVSILFLAATSCGGSGAFLFALSRPHTKPTSATTILLLLCAACGVGFVLFGEIAVPHARILGASLIVLPLIIGAASFSLRRLQFPVHLVSKR
jgi:hypothetical protein